MKPVKFKVAVQDEEADLGFRVDLVDPNATLVEIVDGEINEYPAYIEATRKVTNKSTNGGLITVEVADLRVSYGKKIIRNDVNGNKKQFDAFKPVHGVAHMNYRKNGVDRCKFYRPISATKKELEIADLNTASREELLEQAKRAVSGNPYEAMSDAELRSQAKSLGIKIQKTMKRAEILELIKKAEDQ